MRKFENAFEFGFIFNFNESVSRTTNTECAMLCHWLIKAHFGKLGKLGFISCFKAWRSLVVSAFAVEQALQARTLAWAELA